MKKLTKDELIQLQKLWYKKAEESGFKDIEKLQGDELVLSQSAAHCYRGTDVHARLAKEEYFTAMAKAAQDEETHFRNETDRYILIRFSEGAAIKDIVCELDQKGTPRHRHSIRFIIRRYEMIWGFKFYSKKELNIKIS